MPRKTVQCFVAAMAALALETGASAADGMAEVRTSNGLVHGTVLPGVHEYLGMKFGDAKRYEPPVDFTGTYKEQPLQATDFGPACMQVGLETSITYGSEDCLFANVWQPSNATAGSNLPVVVFIYGGSDQFGETEPYNGSAFAYRHDTVYVSVGYRTGPMGWMAFEEDVKAGRPTGVWGNLDQQSGLRWVQREIRNFGGDPTRVIIHGQSSGAGQCMLHMVMPGSKGLMRGVVSESGGLGGTDIDDALSATADIGKVINCTGKSVKECFQGVPALNITSQTYNYEGGPTVDKITIPSDPNSMLDLGHINNFSLIMGALTNDSNKGLDPYPVSVKKYTASVKEKVGSKLLSSALKLYPPDHQNLVQNSHILGSLSTDRMLCSIRRTLSGVNKHLPGQAFMYRFNWWYQSNPKCSSDPNWHDNTTGPRHEDEVTFVMGQPIFMFDGSCCGKWGSRLKLEPCKQLAECVDCWDPSFGEGYHAYFNEKEWTFSQLVGNGWANLARHGTPNDPGAEDWPISTHGAVTKNIVFDADLPKQHKQETTLYDNPAFCELWDAVNDAGSGSKSDNTIVTV